MIEDAKKQAFEINTRYSSTPDAPLNEKTPVFRNFSYSNITIINAAQVAKVVGLPEKAIEQLRFSDINATGKIGFLVEQASDVELHHVRVNAASGTAFAFEAANQVVLDDVVGNGSAELGQLGKFSRSTGVRQSAPPAAITP